MANRPLYNGSARVSADNNGAGGTPVGLINRFTFRASTAGLSVANELIDNATFEAEAGQTVTLNYDIRKFGAGVELDTPTEARILINKDNNNENSLTANVQISADLIASAALPRTGTVTFTPTTSGTYRIGLYMKHADVNAAKEWLIFSDGTITNGALSSINNPFLRDKGRLRYGTKIESLAITERGSPAPSLFALTMGGGATQESVRITATAKTPNLTTSREVFRIKQRRNGDTIIDLNQSATGGPNLLVEDKVNIINYPLPGTNQLYDTLVACETTSALHDNNTVQYSALAAQAASGNWCHFIADGTFFVDYQTAQKLSSHTVNAGGTIENIFCKISDTYTETAGVPNGTEDFSFIATAANMTVKTGRVVNARGEPLAGIFVLTTVTHAATSAVRDSWGSGSDPTYATASNGWQSTSKVVTVATPPAGLHNLTASAYFPDLTTPEFQAARSESGSPSSASTGKDWIAPASFANAIIVLPKLISDGVPTNLAIRVWDKEPDGTIVARDADAVPDCKVFRYTSSGNFVTFATPTVTKRPGTTGIYDAAFTPTIPSGNSAVYEVDADVIVTGFKKRYGTAVLVTTASLLIALSLCGIIEVFEYLSGSIDAMTMQATIETLERLEGTADLKEKLAGTASTQEKLASQVIIDEQITGQVILTCC